MPREPQLEDPVQYLKGVGPRRAADLARLGVRTVYDLLFTFPRRLSDRSGIVTVEGAACRVGETVCLHVQAIDVRQRRIRGRRTLVEVCFADETGELDGIWFNAPWVVDQVDDGDVILYGRVERKGGRLQMAHPQMEAAQRLGQAGSLVGRIVPIYPLGGCLTQRAWVRMVEGALRSHLALLPETLPEALRAKRQLMERQAAVRTMHFPPDEDLREAARHRLAYEECLVLQLLLGQRRLRLVDRAPGRPLRCTPQMDERIRALLPFRLTAAQERSVTELTRDLARPRPMHRLLQGDVGCGKTVVAFYAALVAVANGGQVAVMAPTELLARQHLRSFQGWLGRSVRSRVRLALLVGGMQAAEADAVRAEILGGVADIVISTHAAIEDSVVFNDLALVVIDEQHKFGVEQRLRLAQKGEHPHLLVMTATPIPRSLALTLYGDLDVTTIDALPPGRQGVATHLIGPDREGRLFDFLRRELRKGRQAYVVCPLVEENEEMELRSATEVHGALQGGELSSFRLGLLHGRMGRGEQDAVMAQFRRGALDVLVSTVVIEVGVDVPNATLLVVLHAERFGLAQLHQLRGRVARGTHGGYCILVTDKRAGPSRQRLEVLVGQDDGFAIAEADLALRGAGEFLGRRQSGRVLALTSLVDDLDWIRAAREDGACLLEMDAELATPALSALRSAVESMHERGDVVVGAG